MKQFLLSLIAVCVLCFSCCSIAGEITVPVGQPTIQAAINVATDGDTIIVSEGTYVENIDMLGMAITQVVKHTLSVRRCLILGVCTTCMGMYGNGCKTGIMVITKVLHLMAVHG